MARTEQMASHILLKEPLSPEDADQLMSEIVTSKATIMFFSKDENGELIHQTQNPNVLLEMEDRVNFGDLFSRLQESTIKIIYQNAKLPSETISP